MAESLADGEGVPPQGEPPESVPPRVPSQDERLAQVYVKAFKKDIQAGTRTWSEGPKIYFHRVTAQGAAGMDMFVGGHVKVRPRALPALPSLSK